jgi:hypothetical protein
MRLHLDGMRSKLVGPNPDPLDELLIDRILAAHIQAIYFDAIETTDPTAENLRVARYRMDRRDQAHRQFLSAVKMLATVRNLVARTATIQVEMIHRTVPKSPRLPMIMGVYGEEPNVQSGQMFEANSRFDAQAVNGMSRINGHGHVRELLASSDGG